jgi:dipeptidase E
VRRRLVLLSTSTVFGTRFLEHAFAELRDALAGVRRVQFIRHALQDRDGYAGKARAAFEEMGFSLDSLHEAPDPVRAVAGGMVYSGARAGSNLACPTIRTTNDMPIVEPPSLDALGLVPFQINPHYLDPVPGSTQMGETRETSGRSTRRTRRPSWACARGRSSAWRANRSSSRAWPFDPLRRHHRGGG